MAAWREAGDLAQFSHLSPPPRELGLGWEAMSKVGSGPSGYWAMLGTPTLGSLRLVVVDRPGPRWHQEKPEGAKHRVPAPWGASGWEGLPEEGLCPGEGDQQAWEEDLERTQSE